MCIEQTGEQIADEANVVKATLYKYFPSSLLAQSGAYVVRCLPFG